MVISGDEIHYTVNLSKFDFEFHYDLDEDKGVKRIDLELTHTPDGRGIGQKFLGIYSFDNERRLRICYGRTNRPSGFMAGAGSHNTLIVLQRKE